MAKYLTEFNTYAEYSGATLSLPNVSLIKTTGKVYYKNIFAGDTLGDVLMYDIANDKLVASLGGQWDATTYPISSYTPIAINVYPASQTPDGKNRYMAVRWAATNDSTGKANSGTNPKTYYGPNDFVPSGDDNSFNGRANQDAAEDLMPGTTGGTQSEYGAFQACSIFAPPGTQAGDWYLPAIKELSLYSANYSTINGIITAIKTAAGSSYIDTVNASQISSTTSPANTGFMFFISTNSSIDKWAKSNSNFAQCRAMISL